MNILKEQFTFQKCELHEVSGTLSILFVLKRVILFCVLSLMLPFAFEELQCYLSSYIIRQCL